MSPEDIPTIPPQPDYLTPEYIAALHSQDYAVRIALAKKSPVEQKLRAGGDLFDLAYAHLRVALRIMCPDASEEDRMDLLRTYLTIARALDNPGLKRPQ
jgi:hypothetical protein